MNRQIKIGIIGTGRWARIYAGAYSKMPEASVVCIAGRNAHKAREFANEIKAEYYYDNFDQLLQDPKIDAVSILVPARYFPRLVMEAANNGKHILCEKPLALTLDEARQIYSVVEKKKVKLQVGFDRRFNSLMVKLRRICKEKRFGEPKVIISKRSVDYMGIYGNSRWRFQFKEGGGALSLLCPHDFDLIPWITGNHITDMIISGGPLFYGLDADDYCSASLVLSNGTIAQVEACIRPESSWDFQVIFKDIRIQADIANSQLRLYQNGEVKVEQIQKILTVDSSIRSFLDSIINDTSTCTSKEEMLATVRILEVARKIIGQSLGSHRIATGSHSFR